MKNLFLLPASFKKVGWVLFIPALALGLFTMISGYEFPFLKMKVFSIFPPPFTVSGPRPEWLIETNLTNTITGLLLIIASLLIGFSRERHEDEYISGLRLSALLWAVLVNYILLMVAFLIVYDLNFLTIMTYNMFTVLLLFIFRFHYLLYRSQILSADEK